MTDLRVLAVADDAGSVGEVLAYAEGGRVLEVVPHGKPKALYVRRDVLNAKEIIAWAKGQGLETTLPADDMHVTVCFSRKPVDWLAAGRRGEELSAWDGERRIMALGPEGEAIVLQFRSEVLHRRWAEFLAAGATWDWPEYHPHITLTYNKPEDLPLSSIQVYDGPIRLGPEIFEELEPGWADGIKENAQAPSNAHIDFAQIGRDLDGLEARAQKDLRAVIVEWREAIVRKVTKAYAGDGLSKLAQELRLPRRGDFTDAMREALRRAWEKGSKDARAEVKAARRQAREHAGDDSTFTPREALRWLGEKAFWITSITGDKLLNEARGVILQSVKTGRPLGETILGLAAVFAPYIGDENVIGDDKQTEPYRLETIVRTNTTDAYNHGRLTEFVRPEMQPFLVGLRYSAVLDERTTEVCRFLNGRVFRPGSNAIEQLLPPNHFNCRSIVVPVVVGEQVPVEDFITEAEIGEAKGMADTKFLTLHVGAWKTFSNRTEDLKWS